jgi:hypothetical protein
LRRRRRTRREKEDKEEEEEEEERKKGRWLGDRGHVKSAAFFVDTTGIGCAAESILFAKVKGIYRTVVMPHLFSWWLFFCFPF